MDEHPSETKHRKWYEENVDRLKAEFFAAGGKTTVLPYSPWNAGEPENTKLDKARTRKKRQYRALLKAGVNPFEVMESMFHSMPTTVYGEPSRGNTDWDDPTLDLNDYEAQQDLADLFYV